METYQIRVEDEHKELLAKVENLRKFLKSDKMATLNAEQTMLLRKQLEAMGDYQKILEQRIETF